MPLVVCGSLANTHLTSQPLPTISEKLSIWNPLEPETRTTFCGPQGTALERRGLGAGRVTVHASRSLVDVEHTQVPPDPHFPDDSEPDLLS